MKDHVFPILLILVGLCGDSSRADPVPTRSADPLWPTYRHDRSLSGMSPLKGGLGQRPVVSWSIDLGGTEEPTEQWRFDDFNGDGVYDYLRILDDRLICEDLTGQRLWEITQLTKPEVLEVRDFSGTGSLGILLKTETGTQTRYHMIDGSSGKMAGLYSTQNVFGNSMRIGSILPGVSGQQLCAWWSGEVPNADPVGHGYLWSFEEGPAKPQLRFEAHPSGTIYAPLHLFADVDSDGRTDMVMISHENVWCWDLEAGELKYHQRWGPEIRTYWAQTAAIALRPGERPSLLMINPMLPGVQVVAQDGRTAKVKWKRVVGAVEDQYQTKVTIGPGAPDPFIDLDGDGSIEIVAAVHNEHGDGRDHLVIFDADDGDRVFDVPDLRVIAVDDMDGDGVPEVWLDERGAQRIAHWQDDRFVNLWSGENMTPLLMPRPPEGDLQRAVGARNTGSKQKLWRESPRAPLFLVRIGDAQTAWACKFTRDGGLEKVREHTAHKALGNVPDPNVPSGTYRAEGNRIEFSLDGKLVRTRLIPVKRNFLPAPPLVGELGGETRVVARDYGGSLISYSAGGADRRALIAQADGPVEKAHLAMDAIGVICDLDADGENELVAGTQAQGLAVVAVDGVGRVTKRFPADGGGSQWVLGGTGRLGDGRGCSVVVRHKTGNDSWASPWVVDAYDGRSGKRLWRRSSYGRYGDRDVKFALHIPTAFYDYNRDGVDDLLVQSENFYGIIDLSNGNDLVTPAKGKWFSDRIPGHWTAYATPIVARLLGENQAPHVLMSRAFALTSVIDLEGNPHWHYGLTRDTTARSHAGIGDLDGDGKLEVVTSQADGRLRAFDADPTNATCPTCPPHQQPNADTRSGRPRWDFKLEGPVSDIASADLDGDGRHELLVGSDDGWLRALKEVDGKCTVLWAVAFEAPVGSPVIADLNNDGVAEVLAPTGDGRLHCLSASP